MELDIGRVEVDYVAANAAEVVPVVLRTHAAAIHDDSGIGKCWSETNVFQWHSTRVSSRAKATASRIPDFDLRFSGDVRGVR